MERNFIQTPEFSSLLADFKKYSDAQNDEILITIEMEVLKDLKNSLSKRDIIKGTGGFTKLRIPLKIEKRGKSGSSRIIYFDCPKAERTFLVLIYKKSEIENISASAKKALKNMAKELEQWQPKKKK